MGVIHKLKPEIREFILKQKKALPRLSCRKFSTLISEKFKIKISKSQINSLIKSAGLSSPVGRTRKRKRPVFESEGLGAFILKSADGILEGLFQLVDTIKLRLKLKKDLYSLTEALVYQPLFSQDLQSNSGLWKMIGNHYSNENISSYLNELQSVTTLNNEIMAIISKTFEEILSVRITFSDGTMFYLDGQFYTLWSTPLIPYDFSITNYKIKSYINKLFKDVSPLILFTAPGYETLPKEWFDFLLRLDSPQKRITEINLLGAGAKPLELIPVSGYKSCHIIFGLWPWQHTKARKVEFLGDFMPFNFAPLNKDFYLAETVIKFTQLTTNQVVTLRGVCLKQSLETKPQIAILSNIPKEKASAEEIANLYLNRWPNLQEGFEDFSRKIELFTYSASARQPMPKEKFFSSAEKNLDIKEILNNYLVGLDAYVRWYLLLPEYKEADFSTTKERFYSLKAKIKKRKNAYLVEFTLPENYPYKKDLAYCLARMNERQITLADGMRVWFARIA